MTPKEKAQQLYGGFRNEFRLAMDSSFDKHDIAKACALSVSKECIEATYSSKTLIGEYYDSVAPNDCEVEKTSEFWQEVTKEIKLIEE